MVGGVTPEPPKDYNALGNPYSWEEIHKSGLHLFPNFLAQVWDFLGLPEPTPVQVDVALNLQYGPRRLIIQAFRGMGKSWITVAFALWLLFMNPQLKIEVISASGKLAEDWVKFARQIIDGMPLLAHLKPRRGQRSKSTVFDVGPAKESKDPSIKAAGIDGQITGTRADVIIPDDIEIPKNSFTAHLREKLADQVKEFDAILKPGGRVLYLGTPQNEDSIYPKLARERGYSIRVWPSEIPEDPTVYHGNLSPFVQKMIDGGAEKGTPVDPKRFNRQDLDERLLSYGRAGYALQFMLDTNPSDAEKFPLKLKDLMVMDLDKDHAHVKLAWGNGRDHAVEELRAGGFDGDRYYFPAWKSDEMSEFSGTVMAIDPSGRGNDETAYAIVRYLHGMLYWVASGGFKSGFSEETLSAIAATAARHGVNYVIAEENYGGGMFNQLLRPHLAKYNKGCPTCEDLEDCPHGRAGTFDDDWDGFSRGQKELRILDILEPVFGSHKLVVDRRVIEEDLQVQEDKTRYSVVQQITRLARERDCLAHDDRVEALAMACAYWTDKMDRDSEKEHKRHKDRLLQQELKSFKDHVFDISPQRRRRRARNRPRN